MAQRFLVIPRVLSDNAFFALRHRCSVCEYEERVSGEVAEHRDWNRYKDCNIGPEEWINSLGRSDAIDEQGNDADVHERSGGRDRKKFYIFWATGAAAFEHEKFVPEERVCHDDREGDGGEERNLNAACDAGDPHEKIEDADAKEHVEYSHQPVADEFPAESPLQQVHQIHLLILLQRAGEV